MWNLSTCLYVKRKPRISLSPFPLKFTSVKIYVPPFDLLTFDTQRTTSPFHRRLSRSTLSSFTVPNLTTHHLPFSLLTFRRLVTTPNRSRPVVFRLTTVTYIKTVRKGEGRHGPLGPFPDILHPMMGPGSNSIFRCPEPRTLTTVRTDFVTWTSDVIFQSRHTGSPTDSFFFLRTSHS